MILHLVRNPDTLPDLEIRDELDNLIATVYNQVEGDPSDPSLWIAETIVDIINWQLGNPPQSSLPTPPPG